MGKSSELGFNRGECCRRIFEVVPKQLELARMLGVTPSAISNTKKRDQCSLELVIAASKITGRPIEWFLFGEEGAAPGPIEKRLAGLEKSVEQLAQRVDKLEEAASVDG